MLNQNTQTKKYHFSDGNTKKKFIGQTKIIKASFIGSNITKYTDLNTAAKYMNRQNIIRYISLTFSTEWHNSTKFGVTQFLMAITLDSTSGISRICRIAAFRGYGLVKLLLILNKGINENTISATLKSQGQSGTRKLLMLLLSKNVRWLSESGLNIVPVYHMLHQQL